MSIIQNLAKLATKVSSSGTISYADLGNKPEVLKVTSISYPGDDLAADPAGGQTITLTGSGFAAGAQVLVDTVPASVVTVVSSTSITFTAPAKSAGTYVLYVVNTDGSVALSLPGISYSGTPAWSTSAGTLGTQYETTAVSKSLVATGDGTITYSLLSGTLPPGSTLNSATGAISGTAPVVGGSTTYNFTIRATDAQNQDTDRAFSITISPDIVTWSSPIDNYSANAEIGTAVSIAMSASAATGNSISYSADTLPTGLSISGNNISGTPTVVGTASSVLTATSATSNRSATRTITWTIIAGSDAYFKYNTALLRGEGTNGAQNNTFLDSSGVSYTSALPTPVIDPSTALNGWFTRTGTTQSSVNTSPREYIVRANGVTIYSSTSSFPTSVSYGGVTYTPGTYIDSAYGWSGDYVNRFAINANTAVFTSNILVRNGTPTQGTFSPYGNNWSTYFGDGSTSTTLSFPGSVLGAGGAVTIECWIYPTSSSFSGLFDGTPNVVGGLRNYGNNTIAKQGQEGSGAVFTVTTNKWQHFAAIYDTTTGTIKVYIDGTLNAQGSFSGGYTCNRFDIGTVNNGGDGKFPGYISNFRVTTGIVYSGNFTPSNTPLTAITGTTLLTCNSNRFKDSSSGNLTASVLYGTPSIQRFNPFGAITSYDVATIGGSGYFNTNNYLSVAGIGTLTAGVPYCIEMWVYPTDFRAGEMRLCGGSSVAANDPLIQFNSNTGLQVFVNNSLVCQYTSTFKPNQWYHIAVTRNSSNVTNLYLNGTSVASGANSYTSANGTFMIGAQITAPSIGLVGYLSDFRAVVGSVVYSSNFTPPTTPLTAIANTSLLCNFTNAGILDNAMISNFETVGNVQLSTSVKKYGTGSIAFDGTGGYLTTTPGSAGALGTGDFTIEMWVYFNNLSDYQYLIDFRPDSTNGAYITLQTLTNSNNIIMYSSSATRITGATGSISAGSWIHVALCRASGSTRLFINGVQSGSTYADTTNYLVGPRNPVIGANAYTLGTYYVNGYIDDLRITKGLARYTENFTPPTTSIGAK